MSSNTWAEIIKSNVSIEEHIGRFDNLQQRGNILQGDHHKHTSENGICLMVRPDSQSFYCFHCEAGGDIISYEMDRLGVDFKDACISLAEMYNIELPQGKPLTEEEQKERKQAKERRNTVAGLLNAACEFYHDNLGEHREYFEKRGFKAEIIDNHRLGYADGNRKSLYNHLTQFCSDDDMLESTGLFYRDKQSGKLSDSLNERYIFPYFINNIGDVSYFIGRDATGKHKAKYHKIRVNGSDDAVEHVLWNGHSIKNNDKPIIVCEGIVDALLVKQEFDKKYYVVSPVTTRINAPDIDRITDLLSQRKHKIIFLNDNEDNQSGTQGALDTADKVLKSVVEKLQKKFNYDPNANEKTRNEISGKIVAVLPEILIATLRKPSYQDKVDAADFIQARKIQELEYWIEAARSVKQVKEYLNDDPQRFFDAPKGRDFRLKYLTDEVLYEGRYFITAGDKLHEYKHKDGGGFYDGRTCEAEIVKLAKRKLGKYHGVQRANEVVASLKIDKVVDVDNFNRKNINYNNGILDISTMKLRKSTVDDIFINILPVNYEPDAECPNFDKFLSEVVPGTEQIIYEMGGYAMQGHCDMEKAFIMLGGGENGKSILLRVVAEILGKQNISSVSPQELSERFGPANLFGKLACINNDIPNRAFATSDKLKQIISGENMSGEFKNRDRFDFEPCSTLIYAGNEMPKSYDHTHGYYRRFVIVKFEQKFEEGDPRRRNPEELHAELISEADGIANKFIEHYAEAHKNGKFTENELTKAAKDEYKADNEPVLQFIDEFIVEDDGDKGFIRVSEMNKRYGAWCDDNDVKKLKSKELKAVLESKFDSYRLSNKTYDGKNFKAHIGIRMLKTDEVAPTPQPPTITNGASHTSEVPEEIDDRHSDLYSNDPTGGVGF